MKMNKNMKTPLMLPLALAGLLAAAPAFADDDDDRRDHERARMALEAGEIQPMARILQSVSEVMPGDVIEVELDRERLGWVYEIKMIDTDGHRRKVYVDAQTGEVLSGASGRKYDDDDRMRGDRDDDRYQDDDRYRDHDRDRD